MGFVRVEDSTAQPDNVLVVAVDVPSHPETRSKVVAVRVPDGLALLAEWPIRAVNHVENVPVNLGRRRVVLPPQSKVHSQVRTESEVILEVDTSPCRFCASLNRIQT